MLRLDLTQIEIFFVFNDFSPLCALKNYETCVRCCVAKQGINNVLSGNNEENYFFEEPFVKFFFKTKKNCDIFFYQKPHMKQTTTFLQQMHHQPSVELAKNVVS